MAHYNSYESFKTKKSIDKKKRAKEKTLGKKNNKVDDFVIKSSDKYGIVIEVKLLQTEKAPSPTLVTLLGMMTEVKPLQP